jgi:hypothetical protein
VTRKKKDPTAIRLFFYLSASSGSEVKEIMKTVVLLCQPFLSRSELKRLQLSAFHHHEVDKDKKNADSAEPCNLEEVFLEYPSNWFRTISAYLQQWE